MKPWTRPGCGRYVTPVPASRSSRASLAPSSRSGSCSAVAITAGGRPFSRACTGLSSRSARRCGSGTHCSTNHRRSSASSPQPWPSASTLGPDSVMSAFGQASSSADGSASPPRSRSRTAARTARAPPEESPASAIPASGSPPSSRTRGCAQVKALTVSSTAAGPGCSGGRRKPTASTATSAVRARCRHSASKVSRSCMTKPPPCRYSTRGRGRSDGRYRRSGSPDPVTRSRTSASPGPPGRLAARCRAASRSRSAPTVRHDGPPDAYPGHPPCQFLVSQAGNPGPCLPARRHASHSTSRDPGLVPVRDGHSLRRPAGEARGSRSSRISFG